MSISHPTLSPLLTLEAVLCDTRGGEFRAFAAYLQHTYCLENLSFWLAVECYTTHVSRSSMEKITTASTSTSTSTAVTDSDDDSVAQNTESSLDTLPTSLTGTLMEAQCHAIVSMYITSDAPHEINIPCEIRLKLLDQLDQNNYHPSIFTPASNYILELMRTNSFIPWLLEPNSPDSLQSKSKSQSKSQSQYSYSYSYSHSEISTHTKPNSHPNSNSNPKPHPHQLQQQHQRSLSFPMLTLGGRISRLKPNSRRSMSLMDGCVLDQPLLTTQPKSMLKRIKLSLFRTDLQPILDNQASRLTGEDNSRWPSWKKLQR
ncbi:RGS domain-containing protein [Phycomyces blakesleeanus]|uniref:RGS domain-containing protein n=1 Tax=Phycomyces blakesleeanus TaxID=4837 RepID=A0ABR3AI01_PHYBL